MYEIKLIIETDDEAEIERLSDVISEAACPVADEVVTVDHACRIPWFVVTTKLSVKTADGWRDTLNR